MPLWASQGKARKIPDFSAAFMVFPWFCHRSITPESYPIRMNRDHWIPIRGGRTIMIVTMRGWWEQFRNRRRHRKDVVAFQRLMDARAARRAAHH